MKRLLMRTESCIAKCLIGILIISGILNMLFVIPVGAYAEEYGDSASAAENAQILIVEVSEPEAAPEVSEEEGKR